MLSADKLLSILLNGLTNALKFCKNGSVVISLSKQDGSLIMTITDSGAGFDDKTLPFLLEPFTKGHDFTPGAGLGLHITKLLVELIGGSMSIHSTPNVGTTFQVTMPVAFSTSHVSTGSSRPTRHSLVIKEIVYTPPPTSNDDAMVHASSSPPDAPAPLRVMVVDDNLICRRVLSKALKRNVIPIVTKEADNGQLAVDLYPTFQPDLVLTDVSMPVMDGVTAAQHMRRIGIEQQLAPCKIHAITGLGLSDPRMKTAGLLGSAALDGWLVKGQDDLAAINAIISDLWAQKTASSLSQATAAISV